ncbi:hypothetical protein COL27_29875, partial [Bacillus sp. AFS075960]
PLIAVHTFARVSGAVKRWISNGARDAGISARPLRISASCCCLHYAVDVGNIDAGYKGQDVSQSTHRIAARPKADALQRCPHR